LHRVALTKKKILIVSQYFYPETFRGNDIAFHLAAEGHSVHVVTGIPNYPAGKFFPGYGVFSRRSEVVSGVRVTRLPIFPRGKGKVSLLLNYFSFMVVGWVYVLFHALFHRYDVVFCQQLSPVMMSAPAVLYKKLYTFFAALRGKSCGVRLYTWVLDLWPDILSAMMGISSKPVLGYVGRFAAAQYKWSDRILISSESFREKVLAYDSSYDSKIVYYPQWSYTEDCVVSGDSEAVDHAWADGVLPVGEDDFVVMFAGNVGEAQGFECNMEAALMTRDNQSIKWVIVGDGRKQEWVKEFVERNGLDSTVYVLGHYPADRMASLYAKADVLLASLDDSQLFSLYLPAKISSYMSSGKPIVTCMNGEGAEVVRAASCGWGVPAGDAAGLASLVVSLAGADPATLAAAGAAGRAYYESHFEKGKCLERLDDIMFVMLNKS